MISLDLNIWWPLAAWAFAFVAIECLRASVCGKSEFLILMFQEPANPADLEGWRIVVLAIVVIAGWLFVLLNWDNVWLVITHLNLHPECPGCF